MARRHNKTPRVPEVPDILHPKVVGQEDVEFDEEDGLETITRNEFRERLKKIRGEEQSVEGPRYVHDLGIGKILQQGTELSIPRWEKTDDRGWESTRRTEYTHATVSKAIEKIFTVPSDLATANYRLAVFDYLLNNWSGFENFNRVFQNLNSLIVQGLQRSSRDHEKDVWARVSDYGLIFGITEHYIPFGKDAPEALQKMDSYFKALKQSHSHKKMGELASKLSKPYDINLRVRVDPTNEDKYDNYPWVVSASVVKASEFAGEFRDEFKLDHRYESRNGYDESKSPVEKILQRAIELKYDRHLSDTAGYISATLRLFEPMLIYMGFINFMREQQKRGIEFCRPHFSDKEGIILSAKNPLVTNEPVIGNDIQYSHDRTVKVVTGPNNGGKTVYIKTVGMIHALAQRGFYVPASKAELRFVDDVYTHFVNPDDIANAEGRYKNEMRRMDEIFNSVTPNSMVILDEPCGGTTIESGEKVSREFLQAFGTLGNLTYLTTHMGGLADAVNSGIIPKSNNLHMHMEEDGTPTYQLREGASPMHYGDFIPKQMNLDHAALSRRLAQRASQEGFSFT